MRLLQCPQGHPCSAGKPLWLLPWQRSLLPSLALGTLIFHSFQNSSDNRQGLKQKDASEDEASHTSQSAHGPTSPCERVQNFKEVLAIPHTTHMAPSPGLQHLCPGRDGLGAPWKSSSEPSSKELPGAGFDFPPTLTLPLTHLCTIPTPRLAVAASHHTRLWDRGSDACARGTRSDSAVTPHRVTASNTQLVGALPRTGPGHELCRHTHCPAPCQTIKHH